MVDQYTRIFNWKGNQQNHQQQLQQQQQQQQQQQERQGHICNTCGKIYKQRNALWRHFTYECGKSPRFQCPYCRYRTKQRSNMYSHIKHKHFGLNIYVIDLENNQ
ncbi:PREDICTED: longitudinals lacking protein, isoforms A/B/D/L-like [Polistes dominula]|uniref:Longitudinals lacking protein, isoforms A/B/D/L-like n=1 Tax=Polistes dominula TaxID=743375 RepID=A0ABM1IEI3_POLDO|nr:PREDICTED: longitudinals lacking protein, isoforms A/B/D/L-like [Polistes dominula]